MIDLLLPRTDAGALVQLAVLVGVYGAVAVAVRRRRELLVFVTGLAVLGAALMGLRALH